eukprot:CAMPEP_0179878482 /NCGR_PEP_ID=MMETSP0982-20121206/25405_1 /TAXON_ID=483367 /ORGANISM="non described non described, Strain CCMP 2436" /LENGTH=75 /DNA_ID=CAMNT_0021771267 /DNA_START=186 /DNA_END=413 /DNA_ORIENTATION=+
MSSGRPCTSASGPRPPRARAESDQGRVCLARLDQAEVDEEDAAGLMLLRRLRLRLGHVRTRPALNAHCRTRAVIA